MPGRGGVIHTLMLALAAVARGAERARTEIVRAARRTLDSVTRQTLTPALWVIVDDGSTDETPAIVEEYAARFPYIRLVRRSDRGEEIVLAQHVAAFDLGEDDRVVFTNGFGVFVLDGDRPRVLLRDKLIAQVTAGPAATIAPAAAAIDDAKPGWASR